MRVSISAAIINSFVIKSGAFVSGWTATCMIVHPRRLTASLDFLKDSNLLNLSSPSNITETSDHDTLSFFICNESELSSNVKSGASLFDFFFCFKIEVGTKVFFTVYANCSSSPSVNFSSPLGQARKVPSPRLIGLSTVMEKFAVSNNLNEMTMSA